MICTEGLTHRYGGLVALQGIDLRIGEGEVFGLIGPNGAGKTTTLKVLATLLRPTEGEVKIDGVSLLREPKKIRKLIGYMPDFAGVYEDMRVDEYLAFFAAAADITGKKAGRVIQDVLELTDLAGRRESLVETLSRGMRQRLGVARVLLHDPKVLLLDEPASGLDPRARVEMRMLLRELRSMAKTIVISSHILSELAEVCTSVGVIEGGKLFYQGTVAGLMDRCRSGLVVHIELGTPRAGEAAPRPAAEEGSEPDPRQAALRSAQELLAEEPRIATTNVCDGRLEVHLAPDQTDASFIPTLLIENGFTLCHFAEEPLTLEDAFMHLTQRMA